jgi:putative ABC transport system substrate-binding protein
VYRKRIVELSIANQLPTVYTHKRWVESGGLVSYGANFGDLYRRLATYVDKILKGAKPADLPVEKPTTLELVINLKAAGAMGIRVAPALLVRADEVIHP